MGRKKKEVKPDPRQNRRAVGAPFDGDNEDDKLIIDFMDQVKADKTKVWKRVIADALRLYISLDNGSLAELRNQHPKLIEQIQQREREKTEEKMIKLAQAVRPSTIKPTPPPTPQKVGDDDLERGREDWAKVKNALDKLRD